MPRIGGTCGNEPDCGDDSGVGGGTTSEVQSRALERRPIRAYSTAKLAATVEVLRG